MPSEPAPPTATGRRLRKVVLSLTVWLAVAGVILGIWRLRSSLTEDAAPLMLQGRPARDYFPFWMRRNTNGPGFVAPPFLDHNKLTGQDILTLLRLTERPAPPHLDTCVRLWPSLPAFITSKLPLPLPPGSSEDSVFSAIAWSLYAKPGLQSWMVLNFDSAPVAFQPALLRRFARERTAPMQLEGNFLGLEGLDPEYTDALASLYERHLNSPDLRTRLDAVLGLIRLPGDRSPDYPRLVQCLQPALQTTKVEPAAWNRIGLALLEKPAGANAFRPVFEALATNTIVDELAGIPLARWANSDPRTPLSSFSSAFLDRHDPSASRFLVLSLHYAQPPLAMDTGMVSVVSRVVANTNEFKPDPGRYSDLSPAASAAERLRRHLSLGLPIQYGEPTYAVRLLEHLDVPKSEIARAILPMLTHPNKDVKRGAGILLEKLGPDVGLDPVEMRRPLADPEVFHFIVRWLGRLGPRALGLIPDLVPRLQDPDRVIRELVSATCLEIAPTDPRLLDHWVVSLTDPALQPMAVSALSGYGASVPQAAVMKLGGIVADESTARGMTELRVAAATTLGALGPIAKPAIPQLESASQSPVEAVRFEARRSLDRIQGR